MTELTAQERQKRIDATNENPWVQLARQGRVAWNTKMYSYVGQPDWEKMIASLPEDYPVLFKQELKLIKSNGVNNLSKPFQKIHIQDLVFSDKLVLAGFVFPLFTIVKNTVFQKDVNLSRAIFYGGIRVEKTCFADKICLNDVIVNGVCYVTETKFKRDVSCSGAILMEMSIKHSAFHDVAYFNDTVFKCKLEISDTLFKKSVHLQRAQIESFFSEKNLKFMGQADFISAKFERNSHFLKVEFNDESIFESAEFNGAIVFNNSEFKALSIFRGATFHKQAWFKSVKFQKTTFIGAEFKFFLNIQNADFPISPNFEGVKCEAIYLEGATLKNDLTKEDPEQASSAWASLIRLMEKVHNLPMRQKFHEKLLEVEKEYSTEKSARLFYELYALLGSGRYASLPLIWLATISVLMANMYWWLGNLSFNKALAFSIVNTFPFITHYDRKFIEGFYDSLFCQIAGGAHVIASGILLFMIGLALRNRFRVK